MPPKVRFTKDMVIDAALEVVREHGHEAITVREVASKLGASSQPIFSYFTNMEELTAAVLEAATAEFDEYAKRGLAEQQGFLGYTREYVRFAVDEPRLFAMLFMQKHPERNITDFLRYDPHYDNVIGALKAETGFDDATAERFCYSHCMFVHGLASMIWSGVIPYTLTEIDSLLKETFNGMVMMFRTPYDDRVSLVPSADAPKIHSTPKDYAELPK